MRSFDIFDTLLVRDVGAPTDLFLRIGEHLKASGIIGCSAEAFQAERIMAEVAARRSRPEGEASLDEIYERLAARMAWDAGKRDKAKTVEFNCEERALRGVAAMKTAVAEARREAGRVGFLSDMYLPSDFLRVVLRREGFFVEGDEIYVSNEVRAAKHSGELYKLLLKKGWTAEGWVHTGDNKLADVEMPSWLGIQAVQVSAARLNRHEELARGGEGLAPLWRGQMSGAMRVARLSKAISDPHLAAVWDSACDVVGPLLFGFVHWCLETAAAKNLQRLYFVARDGQIFFRIAQHLKEAWKYPVECRYLYGSRRAWHPAAASEFSEAQLEWLAPVHNQLSVRQIFARINLGPDAASDVLMQGGFPAAEWDRPLTEEESRKMREVLVNPIIKALAAEAAKEAAALAIEYLRQEGLMDPVSVGVVDIGWFGNMQRSLCQVLEGAGGGLGARVTGLYLGLMPGARGQADKSDYWSRVSTVGQPIERQSLQMLEMFASATHPTVIGYQKSAGRVAPALHPGGSDSALKWGVAELQEGSLEFARQFARMTDRRAFSAEDFQIVARRIYEAFYFHPSAAEARAWGGYLHLDTDIEPQSGLPAPDWPMGRTLKAMWDYRQRPAGWWPEGMLALRSNWPLVLFLAARRARWRFLSFFKSNPVKKD